MIEKFEQETVLRRTPAATGDRGLNSYMRKVYNFMTLGVGISGLVAYFASTYPPLMQAVFGSGLFWLVAFAPLVMVMIMGSAINKMSAPALTGMFIAYSALMGLSLSSIFLAYTNQSIVSTFLVVMGLFGAMSLYGYTTKKDLTSMGSFLMMGVFGLIIAMIVNIFMKNSLFALAISSIAVIIFTGLTAYDVQRIRLSYDPSDDSSMYSKKAIFGALRLYLDFINLFLHLLHIIGGRK